MKHRSSKEWFIRKSELEILTQELKATQRGLDEQLQQLDGDVTAKKKEKNKLQAEKDRKMDRARERCDDVREKRVRILYNHRNKVGPNITAKKEQPFGRSSDRSVRR